jgi:hypothetical protein
VDAPEILTVIGKIPHLSEFLNSLYDCQYKSFFVAFGKWRSNMFLDLFYIIIEYVKKSKFFRFFCMVCFLVILIRAL